MGKSEPAHKHLPHIRDIDAFRYLTDNELKTLLKSADVIRYDSEELIFSQGDPSENFYAVINGGVRVSVRELKKDEIEVSQIPSGDLFGETAIFTSERRTASVTTMEETLVLRIHRKQLLDFFKALPTAGNKILMFIVLGLIGKLKNTNQELALEKQSEIDYDYVDELVADFLKEI